MAPRTPKAKAPAPAPLDPRHFWVCERCSTVVESVDAPAECATCGYEYHDNMYDIDPTFGAADRAEIEATRPRRR